MLLNESQKFANVGNDTASHDVMLEHQQPVLHQSKAWDATIHYLSPEFLTAPPKGFSLSKQRVEGYVEYIVKPCIYIMFQL